MEYRHTPEHNAWTAEGRCDVPVVEPDGSVIRCGYVRTVAALDLTSDLAQLSEPVERHTGVRVMVAVALGILGVAIALDWVAFVLVVAGGDTDPRLVLAFVFRVAASALYGAAVVWLWRRR